MTDGYAAGPPPGIGPGPGGPGPGGEGGPPPGGQYAAGPGPGGPPHGGQYAAGAMQGMPTNGANGAAPDGGYGAPDGVGEKRPRDEDYGSNKRPGNPADGASEGPETVFRLLCDQSIIGPMMQRVSAIQQSTGAFIQAIQEAPPHCVERVIVVSAPKLARPGEMQNDAQKAIYELFDAQLQVDRNSSGPVLRAIPIKYSFPCRMLICATQAGSLIGKSGVTIKEMKDSSGCINIKVLQPADLPPCAVASDKLLHITGNPESLRRVLELCTTRLRDSPPKELPSHQPCQNAYPAGPPGGPPMGPPGGYGGPPGPGGYGGPPGPGGYGPPPRY